MEEDEEEDQYEDIMILEERLDQSLMKKIENLLPRFINTCLPNSFKKNWRWPAVDPDTGLFKEKSSKPYDSQCYGESS